MNEVDTLEIGAAYIRVSTNDQTELSPDAQLREIKKRAKEDGILIPTEYIFIEDRGVSGRRADNRKEFQRMISIAKMQPTPFKHLYLWKFSRFARNQDESVFYKSILRKKCGINIVSVSEPIMEGMFGRLIESIIEWFDEYYSFNLSGEVTRGMTEKAMREGYQSAPCLGYDAVGGGKPFVINDQEYVIAEFIHNAYHEGLDMSGVAREANKRGYKTKRGNPFERRTVHRIITNKFYTGTVTWKDIEFQGKHETRESITSIFSDNQKRIESEYRPQHRREASSCQHWASGLLKCNICGASLGYNKTHDPKKQSDFFQCWKYAKGYHDGSCSISVKKVEAGILDSLLEAAESSYVDYDYVRAEAPERASEEAAILNAISKLSNKERRVKEAYESEVDTLDEYKENKRRLREERESLNARLKILTTTPKRDIARDQMEVIKRIKNAHGVISDPDIENDAKGNALRRVAKKIVYDKDNNQLKFYYYLSI